MCVNSWNWHKAEKMTYIDIGNQVSHPVAEASEVSLYILNKAVQ